MSTINGITINDNMEEIQMGRYIKISIIGLGFVGSAMFKSFIEKNDQLKCKYEFYGYDKFKEGGIGKLEDCVNSEIIFTALPTMYDTNKCSYDNAPTIEVLTELQKYNYNGTVVIKSTVEPTFCEKMSDMFPNINTVHNPEFLTARTAYEDFHNQKHIILGKSSKCKDANLLSVEKFYSVLYPDAEISKCTSTESESVKIYCNTFYAVKIQFFNELYLLSTKIGSDFKTITNLMIKNGWINPMHTNVPGPDGKLSYGGLCFPKDTMALLEFMKKNDVPSEVLEACISERNKMRSDTNNIQS